MEVFADKSNHFRFMNYKDKSNLALNKIIYRLAKCFSDFACFPSKLKDLNTRRYEFRKFS